MPGPGSVRALHCPQCPLPAPGTPCMGSELPKAPSHPSVAAPPQQCALSVCLSVELCVCLCVCLWSCVGVHVPQPVPSPARLCGAGWGHEVTATLCCCCRLRAVLLSLLPCPLSFSCPCCALRVCPGSLPVSAPVDGSQVGQAIPMALLQEFPSSPAILGSCEPSLGSFPWDKGAKAAGMGSWCHGVPWQPHPPLTPGDIHPPPPQKRSQTLPGSAASSHLCSWGPGSSPPGIRAPL